MGRHAGGFRRARQGRAGAREEAGTDAVLRQFPWRRDHRAGRPGGGAAVTTALPDGKIAVTVEIKVNFMAPANGEEIIARAEAMQARRLDSRCKNRGDLPRQGRERVFARSPPRPCARSICPNPNDLISRADDRAPTRTRLFRHPRRGGKTLRPVPRRILAQARPRDGLPLRLRQCADRGRLSLGADPGRIWRRGPEAFGGDRDPGRDPSQRLQCRRLPRPDVHHGHGAAARQRRAEGKMAAADRKRQIAPAGLRRHRAHQRHRHVVAEDGGKARRQ